MANINLNDDSLNTTLRNHYSVWTEEGTRNVKVYLCTTKVEAIAFLNSFKFCTGFVLDKMLKKELHTNAKTFLFNRTKDYIRGKISERKWKLEQSIENEKLQREKQEKEKQKKLQKEKDENPYRMWSYNIHDTFNSKVNTTEISIEIGNIVNKIKTSISGIGGDVTSILSLLKDATMEFESNSVSLNDEKIITKKNKKGEYIFIKYIITAKFKKRRLTGILGFKKEYRIITGEYSILKPDNLASRTWCQQLMDKKITNLTNNII